MDLVCSFKVLRPIPREHRPCKFENEEEWGA